MRIMDMGAVLHKFSASEEYRFIPELRLGTGLTKRQLHEFLKSWRCLFPPEVHELLNDKLDNKLLITNKEFVRILWHLETAPQEYRFVKGICFPVSRYFLKEAEKLAPQKSWPIFADSEVEQESFADGASMGAEAVAGNQEQLTLTEQERTGDEFPPELMTVNAKANTKGEMRLWFSKQVPGWTQPQQFGNFAVLVPDAMEGVSFKPDKGQQLLEPDNLLGSHQVFMTWTGDTQFADPSPRIYFALVKCDAASIKYKWSGQKEWKKHTHVTTKDGFAFFSIPLHPHPQLNHDGKVWLSCAAVYEGKRCTAMQSFWYAPSKGNNVNKGNVDVFIALENCAGDNKCSRCKSIIDGWCKTGHRVAASTSAKAELNTPEQSQDRWVLLRDIGRVACHQEPVTSLPAKVELKDAILENFMAILRTGSEMFIQYNAGFETTSLLLRLTQDPDDSHDAMLDEHDPKTVTTAANLATASTAAASSGLPASSGAASFAAAAAALADQQWRWKVWSMPSGMQQVVLADVKREAQLQAGVDSSWVTGDISESFSE
eukprot:SRR837773.21191.p1 GENE.SRR837773.21191~~SRR837773.21191.p1  ORF type:complete len:544 (-),score=61.96 SRR837773.21191:53-1684(-)